jgi:hypothetical protein
VQFPAELPVRRAIIAGHAHACSRSSAQSSRRGGSPRCSLRHHTWHSGHAGQIARNKCFPLAWTGPLVSKSSS